MIKDFNIAAKAACNQAIFRYNDLDGVISINLLEYDGETVIAIYVQRGYMMLAFSKVEKEINGFKTKLIPATI